MGDTTNALENDHESEASIEGTYLLLSASEPEAANVSILGAAANRDLRPIRILRATAPIGANRDWLGRQMTPDFKAATNKRVVLAGFDSTEVRQFSAEVSRIESVRGASATFAGFGIELSGGVNDSTRVAVYRACEITRIETLTFSPFTRVRKGHAAYIPKAIYYGWSLQVVARATTSSFSAEAAASILGVNARARAQSQFWGAELHVDLRGLVSRERGDEIVIPRGIEDIETRFRIDRAHPQPIYIEYMALENPDDPLIAWPTFTAPHIERFDAASEYRFYRDPRTPPGKLRVTLVNRHQRDGVVFQVYPKMHINDPDRFEWTANGNETRIAEVDTPTWPVSLEWVGHHTQRANVVADGETGWSIDFWRNW